MANKNLFFLDSIRSDHACLHSTDSILNWIKKRNQEVNVDIQAIKLNDLNGWHIEKETANIRHNSGKFFSIEGVNIQTTMGITPNWSQPIIHQPEVGFLGFLVKKINGIYHFLVQAKIEPGNVNNVQLSPTIQATRSNFTQVHKGKLPHYFEYFKNRKGEVLIDQLQSEQGARFFRKRNRNIIIEIEDDIEVYEDFKWVTLGQLKQLLKHDNIVNMDTRTVISSISYGNYGTDATTLIEVLSPDFSSSFDKHVFYSYINSAAALHQFNDLLSWLTDLKSIHELSVNLIPMSDVKDWIKDDYMIYHKEHKYFEVIAVDVTISNREVSSWSQPIIKPCNEGIVAFITKEINGVLHFLVQAKMEVGNLDIVELAPTVQCITGNFRKGENEYEVPFLDYIENAKKNQIKYDVLLSEEGGRFYQNQNRNIIIHATDDFSIDVPDNYKWMTLNQLMRFIQYNNYLNIEARSLLSVLTF